jgi:hypothetical protein
VSPASLVLSSYGSVAMIGAGSKRQEQQEATSKQQAPSSRRQGRQAGRRAGSAGLQLQASKHAGFMGGALACSHWIVDRANSTTTRDCGSCFIY